MYVRVSVRVCLRVRVYVCVSVCVPACATPSVLRAGKAFRAPLPGHQPPMKARGRSIARSASRVSEIWEREAQWNTLYYHNIQGPSGVCVRREGSRAVWVKYEDLRRHDPGLETRRDLKVSFRKT